MLTFLLNLILLLAVLSVLVFVHELGHFLFAKLNGVKVSEFAIGMGPILFSKQFGETKWAIRAFPIGGFVQILGETDVEDEKLQKEAETSPRSFINKSAWQKVSILFAGVLFNFLMASVIYFGLLAFNGFESSLPDFVEDGVPFGEISREKLTTLEYTKLVDGVAKDSGMPDMAVIKSVNGNAIEYSDEFMAFLQDHKEKAITITACEMNEQRVVDDNSCEIYSLTPNNDGMIGVLLTNNYYTKVTYTGLGRITSGFAHSINVIYMNIVGVGDIFNKAADTGDYSDAANSLGGPVALYFIVDYIRSLGPVALLELLAGLNLTLFIVNLVPIPAMDGGRIMLVGVRAVLGDKFSPKVETALISVSFILMMLLMLAIVVKDVVYIDSFKEFLGGL